MTNIGFGLKYEYTEKQNTQTTGGNLKNVDKGWIFNKCECGEITF